MSSSQNQTGLSELDLQIINMLNNMYTNNSIIMDRYLSTNNEILRIIQSLLNLNNNIQQRQNNSITSLPNLANIPELYNNYFVLDYQDSNLTEQIAELLQSIIRTTQVEIENATSLIRFIDIENPLNNSCPISLESFIDDEIVTMIKYCGHIFKTNEINHWFESNVSCPVCRYDIRNLNNTNNTNTDSNTNFNTNSILINQNSQENIAPRNNTRLNNNNERRARLNLLPFFFFI